MRGAPWEFGAQRWAAAGDLLGQVEARSLRKFSRRMDRRLAKLVERWAYAAAPSAIRPPRKQFAKPKPKPK